jgi:hypothetical protein
LIVKDCKPKSIKTLFKKYLKNMQQKPVKLQKTENRPHASCLHLNGFKSQKKSFSFTINALDLLKTVAANL